jgi:translocation and assembly module TamA
MARRPPALALALLVAAASGCLRGRGTADEPVVTAIVLEGAKALKTSDIETRLATQPPTGEGPFGFIKTGHRLDPDALVVDKRRIEAWYRANGFYDAKITDVRLDPDGRGRAKVVLVIEEGSPVHVRSVATPGLDVAPEARAKLEKLPLREGDVFTEAAFDSTRAAIELALKTNGYALAEVVQSAHVLPAEHAADVTFEVRPGPRLRFGPVFIAGSSAVSRDRIREQASIEIRSGEFYDETKLPRAQTRVFQLGVFAGVRVTRGTPNLERGIVPIVISVREAPFRTVRAGPGIAFEATRWEAGASAGWTDRNFYGSLRRVGVDLHLGYAWLPTLFAPTDQGPVGRVTLSYAQPAAISRRIDLTTRLEVERGIDPGYDFWAQRLAFGTPLRLAPRWTLVPSYNVEVYELSNTPSVQPGTPEAVERPLLEGCTSSICLLSYFEQRVAWDGRDDPLNTRRGIYVSFAVQEGTNISGYGYRYVRLLPEFRWFSALGPRLVLAFRTRFGALIPVNQDHDPPVVARFYAGGPLSMRGYYTTRLSPMVLGQSGYVPAGGNGVLDGSLELRYGGNVGWGSAVFLDAGNVAIASARPTQFEDALKLRDLQLALGVGLRYGTPFGPIRLDVGARLPTDFSAGVPFNQRFPPVPGSGTCSATTCYSTHREPIIAVLFSIGEAF